MLLKWAIRHPEGHYFGDSCPRLYASSGHAKSAIKANFLGKQWYVVMVKIEEVVQA